MSSRVAHVTDVIGSAICAGDLQPGDTVTAETVQERTGTSRTGVREALGVLVSLGLLRVRRRIGYEVTPATEWQLLSLEVVRWQLASGGSDASRELIELRGLIEPAAAASAARVATRGDRVAIADAAARMWSAAIASDHDAFVNADIDFHQLVLRASGNRLFASLGGLLAESLPSRALSGEGLSLAEARTHVDLAEAIAGSDAENADGLARRIVHAAPQA